MEEEKRFLERDLSWLSFNYRVLMETRNPDLPLYNRIKFMAIFSSNLDEFFRVRVASLRHLIDIGKRKINKELDLKPKKLLKKIHEQVHQHQEEYGKILREIIIPGLEKNNIFLYMGQDIHPTHLGHLHNILKGKILSFLRPILLEDDKAGTYFLENGELYFSLKLQAKDNVLPNQFQYAYLNIPSNHLPRFYQLPPVDGTEYFITIDDIIRFQIEFIFPQWKVLDCFSIKLNRDADLNIEDEYSGDLVDKIRNQVQKRNIGIPSRFLYDQTMPEEMLNKLAETFYLKDDDLIPGGRYHNLNDLMTFPNPRKPDLIEAPWPGLLKRELEECHFLFDIMDKKDLILHFPYHTYDYVVRFFNEAALDPFVKSIKVTLYRIAANSLIGHSLITAALNGKRVTVFVEVKARFDEENNIRWAQRMEEAGVQIIYSIPGLKVHAKVALIQREDPDEDQRWYGFLGTGNFNEKTAAIYTDHGLLTARQPMLNELDQVFQYLENRETPDQFEHLLVAQFNLMETFEELIDHEIMAAKKGNEARILIKLNNLEEKTMIEKLYEANNAGVKITLIVRSICCLIPGIKGQSEHIKVMRLVDRFLEHARIFVFHHHGEEKIFMGSSDWMKRNLFRRIEVVFPVYDPDIRSEILQILDFQLKDNTKATLIDNENRNLLPDGNQVNKRRAQLDLYQWIKEKENA